MKNKSLWLLIIILAVVGCFAVYASGVKIAYFENYSANFRRNIKGITDSIGIQLPKPVDEFLSKTPEPLSIEEKLEIIEQMEEKEREEKAAEIKTDEELPSASSSKIIAVKNAYAAAYASYKSKLLCATDAYLVCYGKDGEEQWSADIQMAEPILKTAGNYILAAEKNSNKVYLSSDKKKLWERATEDPIVSADVSENGDVVIITDKPHYKGTVSVIDKKGDVVFRWSSGKYEVIDADISSGARKLAVSLLNSENGADSKILFFNLSESESSSSVDVADSIVFDIEFCGETLNAVADNKIMGVSAGGNISWTTDFDGRILHKYMIEDSGYKLCVFDNSNVSQINVLNGRGGVKSSFESQTFPEHVYISDGYLLFGKEHTIEFMTISEKNRKKYDCTRDIYNILILDSKNVAVVYNSSIEFLRF